MRPKTDTLGALVAAILLSGCTAINPSQTDGAIAQPEPSTTTWSVQGPGTFHLLLEGREEGGPRNLTIQLEIEWDAPGAAVIWRDGEVPRWVSIRLGSAQSHRLHVAPAPPTPQYRTIGHYVEPYTLSIHPGEQGFTFATTSTKELKLTVDDGNATLAREPQLVVSPEPFWYASDFSSPEELGEYGTTLGVLSRWNASFAADASGARLLQVISLYQDPGTASLRVDGGGLDLEMQGQYYPQVEGNALVLCALAGGGPLNVTYEVDQLYGMNYLVGMPLPLGAHRFGGANPESCAE